MTEIPTCSAGLLWHRPHPRILNHDPWELNALATVLSATLFHTGFTPVGVLEARILSYSTSLSTPFSL